MATTTMVDMGPKVMLAEFHLAKNSTVLIVKAVKGQALQASAVPNGSQIQPASIANPPRIITAGCTGRIRGLAMKETSESRRKWNAISGKVVNCAARV